MQIVLDWISWFFILGGSFFLLTGSLGLVRFPDFYTRLHPAGLTDSLAAPMVLIGIGIHHGFSLFTLKVFLLIIFLLFSCPTSTHTLAKAALLAGLKPYKKKTDTTTEGEEA